MRNVKTCLLALILLAIWLAAPVTHGQTPGVTLIPLAAFNDTNNGANPYSPPTLGADGNLYGTLPYGGTNNAGVVCRVTTNGTQTTFYNFNTWDGALPVSQLLSGQDGNLYGMAGEGGTNNHGTIFEMTTNGAFTLLYSFGMATNALGYALDGAFPIAGLVQGRDGNFYGTTYNGGVSNVGTVFQFSTNGTLTTLHSFTGHGTNHDGAYPYTAPLVEGADGVFYGTTTAGGTNGDGTIFQVTADGTFTNLFEFNNTDGLNPYAGLSFGTDGNLYGTTSEGGTNGLGTVFQITTNGVLTVLYQFSGLDGAYPYCGLVPGPNNILYGTTYEGGTPNFGTVFQVTTNGQLTTLHSFTNGSDGANPFAGVIRGSNGNLYGTALYAGNQGGYGTVYSLSFSVLLSITSPTANELWSNGVFAVTGTASDNAPGSTVTNVFYSLNGAAWTNPATSNAWINWTDNVALTPGTNTLQAYAMDDAGNISPTNTVIFDYVVVAPLIVLTNGIGTITPTNYNGALLRIGTNYSLTATAGTGFMFTNWTGGTNLPLAVLTNGQTVQFIMASNLILQANFMDKTKPTLTITNLTAGQRVSNTLFTVAGKVVNNWQVANVFYSLNGSGWSNAVTGSNWTNWSAAVTLIPGTNTFAAYAVDPGGVTSLTNSVNFQYVVTNQLQISAIGFGTINPNYSNAWLEVGRNYSTTATAATGFVFTNWMISTNWLGGVTTNNATVQFTMSSNLTLQVTFNDITKPTLSITNLTAGMSVSNTMFTIMGKAGDNWAVSNVLYSLNGAGWSNAMTGNNWTNWNAPATLLPGTNTIAAYAVDTSGNLSTTNALNFFNVITTLMTVSTNGFGTLTPNDNGMLLQIGRGYSITATAAVGFAFTNWTGGTNQPLTLITNGPTIQFLMATNLMLQANFADITKPTLSITNLTAGISVSNTSFTIMGKAGDNWAVSNVLYSLNGAGWSNALTGNNWTNWNAPVTLLPGTNTIAAFAVDTSGNLSTTNALNFFNVITTLLTVSTNGFGTLTPNDNGMLLQIGRGYSITATAAVGFAFTNWTGGTNQPLTLITNGPTIQFLMATNLMLQANFADITKPTLSITNLTAGISVSNTLFTIMGKAGDNWAVSNVLYSLNGVGWSNAMTANNWTNWNAPVTLLPGTNTIAAYAVDTSGNLSTTNALNFFNVITTLMTVSTNGFGTLTPNDNGMLLQIGRGYSITATAAAGFAFTNWTGGTNQPLTLITNGPTIQFLMATNLMLQANFADITKPTLSITNLTAGMSVSNTLFTIMGKAGDNWAVSNVLYSLNGAGWSNALTANNWTNWSAPVTLLPGTNTIAAFAVDTSGNLSTTNSLNFFNVITTLLTVSTNGLGTLTPNDNGMLLQIGRGYSITAAAAAGFAFTNWTGGTNQPLTLITNGPTIQFLMATNLMLQANFADITKPTLTITAPTAGQHMTNALATVVGTASDNWRVASVWYQLNGGTWNQPATTNGWTNWTTTLELQNSTNTVKAYALDLGGNFSTTNSVSCVSSNAFMLQLSFPAGQPLATNGLNFVLQLSPNLNGHVQVSTNLMSWLTLTNFIGTNSTLYFLDPAATNGGQRFYRATIP